MVLKMTVSFTQAIGVTPTPTNTIGSSDRKQALGSIPECEPLSCPSPMSSASSRVEKNQIDDEKHITHEDIELDDLDEGKPCNKEQQFEQDPQHQEYAHQGTHHAQSPSTTSTVDAINVDTVNQGLTEISLAQENNATAVHRALQHEYPVHDLDAIDDLIESAKDGDLPLFARLSEALRQRHITADCAGYMGWTPAHWAAREGHVHILQYLLSSRDADLDRVDRKGDSLLHKAAANGQFRTCQWLLHHGFNVQAKNNNGLTPLDIAQQCVALEPTSEVTLCEAILARESANTF